MNNLKSNNKAEDILTNEPLLEKLKLGASNKEFSSNKEEARLAVKMHKAIRNQSHQLSESEKSELKHSIKKSISLYKVWKLFYSVSAAAAIIIAVIVSSVLLMQYNPATEISQFAESFEQTPSTDNTRLILQGDKEVQINGENSEIEYAKNGRSIKIGDKEVEQEIETNEVIYNTIIVPYGKRSQITLSDNSKVWLNSGSKLVYPAFFSAQKREVYLEGEALFEVSHNEKQPFHVISRDVEIKVLGTVFNVSAYSDDQITSTVLESGSVELKYKTNSLLKQSKLTITPGTLAKYDPSEKSIQQQKVNTKHYTSWRNGELIFESEPLVSIAKKVSRYYNVKITIGDQNLSKETFSGYLDLKKSATDVLKIIGETTDFTFIEYGNEIIIK